MPHEPKVGDLPALLPCPFCGNAELQIVEGSTFRWRFACCPECGAQSPEARVQTIGDGTPEEWEAAGRLDALKEWNTRAEREARKDEARDAARYRWLRHGTKGVRMSSSERAFFDIPIPPALSNIMKGSVAQHFDAAIDASIEASVDKAIAALRAEHGAAARDGEAS